VDSALAFAFLFAFLSFLCVAMVPIGLPGAWIMLGLAVLLELMDGSTAGGAERITFGWPTLAIAGVLVVLGEVIEATAGAAGTRLGGGTARGMFGAILGGLLGAILFTPLIPIPLVGTLIGALLGTFLGAFVAEATAERARHPGETFKAAAGAALGRLAGTLGKTLLAVVNWVMLLAAAFTR
jgi:uncharacterized protein YqgC (DUF456 family)